MGSDTEPLTADKISSQSSAEQPFLRRCRQNLSGMRFSLIEFSGGLGDPLTVDLTVDNVAPVIVALSGSAEDLGNVSEGEDVTITGSFTDVGTLDIHTAVIDWGDGTVTSAIIDQAAGTLTGTHAYQYGGIYTVTVTLTDDDTGEAEAEVTSVVSGIGIHDGVLQIIGTSGNDRAKLNQTGNGKMKVHSNFMADQGKQRMGPRHDR